MLANRAVVIGLVATMSLLVGCARSGAPRPGTLGATMQPTVDPQLTAELQDLGSRLRRFDADNTELHTEVARLQQQLNVTDEEKGLLREQLADASKRLEAAEIARAETDRRLGALQASHRSEVGATISANNSLSRELQLIEIGGLEVRQESDVIKIELPSDSLFTPMTTQISPAGIAQLDQVAAAIRRHYPRQIIGVEAHLDSQSAIGATYTAHQLTATQALAVVHQLLRAGQLAERQLFTMGLGGNRPRFSNGDAAGQARNRRVEIVVYPETYDGI